MESNLNVVDKGWYEGDVIKQQYIIGFQVQFVFIVFIFEYNILSVQEIEK